MVDTSGPVIDEGGGGISAGMSGSPVYTEDGKLIGAIAYVFIVGPSSIGGVTPAPDMLQVFAEGAEAAGQGSAAARLAPGSRARIARAEGVAASAVAEEMGRLRVPVSVSGNPPPRAARRATRCPDRGRCQRDRYPRCERHRLLGSTVGEARAGRRDRCRAVLWGRHRRGDRHDDLRLRRQGGGLRTFLFIQRPDGDRCDSGKVLGIVDDPTSGPFKYATLTEPVGIVDRGCFSAIGARFGVEIPTIPVTQDTTAFDTGNQRLGARTDVVGPTGTPSGRRLFANFAFEHSFTNIDQTFDQIGPGSAGISWTISGVRAGSGQPFALARGTAGPRPGTSRSRPPTSSSWRWTSSRPRTSNRSSSPGSPSTTSRSSGRFVATGLKGSCGRRAARTERRRRR